MANKKEGNYHFLAACTLVYDTKTNSYTVWLSEYGTVTGYEGKTFFDACYLMRAYINNLKRFDAEEIRSGHRD